MNTQSCNRRIFISAGELSGDLLAAQLVAELKTSKTKIDFSGVVGPSLRRQGVASFLEMEDLAVMGITEVARVLSQLRQKEFDLLDAVERWKPDLAILVDYPGFHLRLGEQLRLRGIPVIQYVAPKLWAWGGWRIAKLLKSCDLVLGILPFEEKFFSERKVPYKYIGCPLRDRVDAVLHDSPLAQATRDQHKWTIGLLPGSRRGEWKKILPALLDAVRILREDNQRTFEVLLPVAESLDLDEILTLQQKLLLEKLQINLLSGDPLIHMLKCDCLVAASGTVTLEAALLGIPMVVVYKMSRLSFALAKRFVDLPYVSLVNLVAGKKVVPEILQIRDGCLLASEIINLRNPLVREQQQKSFELIRDQLPAGSVKRAADEVMAFVAV